MTTPTLAVIVCRQADEPFVRGSLEMTRHDGVARTARDPIPLAKQFWGSPLVSANATPLLAWPLWLSRTLVPPADDFQTAGTREEVRRVATARPTVRAFVQRPGESIQGFHARWKAAVSWVPGTEVPRAANPPLVAPKRTRAKKSARKATHAG